MWRKASSSSAYRRTHNLGFPPSIAERRGGADCSGPTTCEHRMHASHIFSYGMHCPARGNAFHVLAALETSKAPALRAPLRMQSRSRRQDCTHCSVSMRTNETLYAAPGGSHLCHDDVRCCAHSTKRQVLHDLACSAWETFEGTIQMKAKRAWRAETRSACAQRKPTNERCCTSEATDSGPSNHSTSRR